jgi:hypothetical protein
MTNTHRVAFGVALRFKCEVDRDGIRPRAEGVLADRIAAAVPAGLRRRRRLAQESVRNGSCGDAVPATFRCRTIGVQENLRR